MNIEDELSKILSEEIAKSIDKEILRTIMSPNFKRQGKIRKIKDKLQQIRKK